MAAACRDWAGLPDEMVATVMRWLDIPDLFRAGTVCTSWYAAYSSVRRVCIPITDAAPCLLYSSRADADAATFYSPSSGASFRARLPDPPLRRRSLVGSAHGWLATADEASNLHLLNPLTGAQVALPPATALYHVESHQDEQGNLVYSFQESEDLNNPDDPIQYPAHKLRLFLYHKVVLSCSPSKGRDCIVLLLHRPDGQMSFARVGDGRWTHITTQTLRWVSGYRDAVYNKVDGLFYVLSFDGSMLTLDLGNPSSPVAKDIIPLALPWDDPVKDIVLTPWGDLLQVWRVKEQVLPEGWRRDFLLYKVDIDKQDHVKLASIGDHALFLGSSSSAVCIPTKDFPKLRPDSAYFVDGLDEETCASNKRSSREICIWDFKTETLRGLGEVQSRNPWLDWPAPVWITPSIH